MSAEERKPRVLVVEDEEHLAMGISMNLEADGFEPVVAGTGRAGLERVLRGDVDLVILDVMLPELSGFEVCAEIRRSGRRVPILFLTAKGRVEDRVRGLEIGGDDYLVKPFALAELLSRVRALLRRQGWGRSHGSVKIGPAEVDLDTGSYTAPTGEHEKLTEKETAVLRALVDAGGEPVSRAAIMDQAWGRVSDDPPTARTIDNFVVRLRKRFEQDPTKPRHILTAFGVGYRFVP